MRKFIAFCKSLPQYTLKPWYPMALAIAALSDYFIFVIPLDAIVVASMASAPKRWVRLSFFASAGSIIGVAFFAEMIRLFGDRYLLEWAPHLLEGEFVQTISTWLQHYGFWALVGIAATPIHQHPTVAIAALAKVPLLTIVITMFIGRMVKYAVYRWLLTHAHKGFERFFKE